ncbi:MAG: prepilin-type N-terminal cleavage/methylation domain-containing protein [Cyanobacteriota bacterium]|nr:prepilin-type N-terminal cleavage/methylation domain-containing protein [Cyanobacteriota bacterium]MDY6382719.1 prepilin-type N-terminal cleavage/methylation domain-containing protein [Cyanobacteriota bacterium]
MQNINKHRIHPFYQAINQFQSGKNNKSAFTLSELLIALGVIAILTAISMPIIHNLLPDQNVVMAKLKIIQPYESSMQKHEKFKSMLKKILQELCVIVCKN